MVLFISLCCEVHGIPSYNSEDQVCSWAEKMRMICVQEYECHKWHGSLKDCAQWSMGCSIALLIRWGQCLFEMQLMDSDRGCLSVLKVKDVITGSGCVLSQKLNLLKYGF